MPGGLGGGPSNEQKQLFAQAAQDSGLAAMGMEMANQMTGGQSMRNEDQLSAIYHLFAAHPNEVALFFLHYPEFLPGIIETIRLVIKQELYTFFSSDITSINTVPEKAAELGYSTITQENITAALAKAAPLDKMQMEVHQSDMNAMQQLNGHAQGQMNAQYQQQMMQQQQMQQMQKKKESESILDKIQGDWKNIVSIIVLSVLINTSMVDGLFRMNDMTYFLSEAGTLNFQAVIVKALVVAVMYFIIKNFVPL